jgi:L-aminopeptidase/D-esterase-like protein
MDNSITDVPGILVGHAENTEAATGCTVILFGTEGAVTGVDVRGGAPGTRETAALDPVNIVPKAHAVYLGGGSAYGLDGAAGVMQFLEEKGIGFPVGVCVVPIVPGAVLFDLNIHRHDIRPDRRMGYQACQTAVSPNTEQGNVGAGTGATIGIQSSPYKMKGGIGTASVQVGDLIVGALVAVNCYGDVIDPETGQIVSGLLNEDRKTFAKTLRTISKNHAAPDGAISPINTTIGIVVSNAKLTKAEATKIAMMTHDGYARAINPVHTMHDGDTVFAAGTGEVDTDCTTLGAIAAEVMSRAVVNGAKAAESAYGIPGYRDIRE